MAVMKERAILEELADFIVGEAREQALTRTMVLRLLIRAYELGVYAQAGESDAHDPPTS